MPKTQASKEPKILFWDVENSHNIVATFNLFKAFIPHDNILQHWFMFCASWKWAGKDKVHTVSLLDDPLRFKEDHTDDYYVIAKIHEALSEADAVVAHNGDRFDMKKFNARAIQHGFQPIPEVIQIDTLKIAKAKFNFNYNKLDFLGEYLGVGKKIKTDNELWLRCLRGERKALKEMLHYNKQDVVVLEKVYDKLKPYVPAKVNFNLFKSTGTQVCPSCGGNHTHRSGIRRTRTREYYRYQCQGCGHWFKSIDAKDVKSTSKIS